MSTASRVPSTTCAAPDCAASHAAARSPSAGGCGAATSARREARAHLRLELRREADLRDQEERLAAARERVGDEVQVDLGLAAAGDAVQEHGWKRRRRRDHVDGAALLGVSAHGSRKPGRRRRGRRGDARRLTWRRRGGRLPRSPRPGAAGSSGAELEELEVRGGSGGRRRRRPRCPQRSPGPRSLGRRTTDADLARAPKGTTTRLRRAHPSPPDAEIEALVERHVERDAAMFTL
jgi:hypothetical protein